MKMPKMTKAKIHCNEMTLMANCLRARAVFARVSPGINRECVSSKRARRLTQSQETHAVAKEIVLSEDDMARSEEEHDPDEDVGDDPSGQAVAVHGDGTVPEDGRQRPRVGAGDGREMHKGGQARVAPVAGVLVDEVGGQDDLGAPEVVTDPQHDPGEDEEVVEDEMGRHVGGGRHQGGVLGEEMPDIAQLGQEEEEPTIDSTKGR